MRCRAGGAAVGVGGSVRVVNADAGRVVSILDGRFSSVDHVRTGMSLIMATSLSTTTLPASSCVHIGTYMRACVDRKMKKGGLFVRNMRYLSFAVGATLARETRARAPRKAGYYEISVSCRN